MSHLISEQWFVVSSDQFNVKQYLPNFPRYLSEVGLKYSLNIIYSLENGAGRFNPTPEVDQILWVGGGGLLKPPPPKKLMIKWAET